MTRKSFFFFSSRRRHTRLTCDWSSDVCSSDLAFPGTRGWGYDGVLPYAPQGSYGTPQELKALIASAHRHGLAMLLDVVYNHFGPEGNYLHWYAPQFFTERHVTPWGPAINFDGPDRATVREFFIHNALYWLEEYHFDGLRLDAIHAVYDA